MKKFIFIFFFILTSGPLYAFDVITQCGVPTTKPACAQANNNRSGCSSMGGCFYDDETKGCYVALATTYAPQNYASSIKCNIPEGTNFVYNYGGYEMTGLSTNTCPWSIQCGTDEYWYALNKKCQKCNSKPGYAAKSNNQQKTIYGCGYGSVQEDDFNERCEPTAISITLNPNHPTREDFTAFNIYVKYHSSTSQNGGFAETANGPWNLNPIQELILPHPNLEWWNKPNGDNIYGFKGYQDQDHTMYITANGKIGNGITINDFEPDMELTGVWQNVYYNVVYYTEAGVQHARLDKININTLTLSSGDTAMPYADGPAIDGKLFIGWTCNVPSTCNTQSGQQNCTKTCDVATVELTDEMPRPSSGKYEALYTDSSSTHQINVHLYPRYTDCPAGYYCVNNQANPCPGGTTTITGPNTINWSITKCFMSGNVTDLKDNFTGDNKKAIKDFIPDASNVKMYYKQ